MIIKILITLCEEEKAKGVDKSPYLIICVIHFRKRRGRGKEKEKGKRKRRESRRKGGKGRRLLAATICVIWCETWT